MEHPLRTPHALLDLAVGIARPREETRRAVPFLVLLAVFFGYAAFFILRTSFTISGERYFSLFDDAMISMRYGRHLASGMGLDWNAGHRVEGFTNPLWVLMMAAVHLLPIPLSKTSLVVQVAAAALLGLNLVFVRRVALAVAGGSEAVALGAAALTAFYLPLNNWSLQGMEVSVLVTTVTIALSLCLSCFDGMNAAPALYALLGVSTWVRPDMAVTLLGIAAVMTALDRPRRRTHLTLGFAALAAGVGSQTLFRLWYFGAPFPNTYYLKMTGYPAALRIAHGVYVLAQFGWKANPLLFVLAAVAAIRRSRRGWLLAAAVATQMAYSVYVGGDAWEYWGGANRYISIAMPAFFILVADALVVLAPSRAAFAALVGAALLCVNSIYGPGALLETTLVEPPLHAGPGGENNRDVEQALALRAVAQPDATVAVTRAGTLPYFSDFPVIDLLGKTDRRVAMEPARTPAGMRHLLEFRPGHSKFDAAYSIGVLRPDVVIQPWGGDPATRAALTSYRAVQLGPACAYVRMDGERVDTSALLPCRGE